MLPSDQSGTAFPYRWIHRVDGSCCRFASALDCMIDQIPTVVSVSMGGSSAVCPHNISFQEEINCMAPLLTSLTFRCSILGVDVG